MSTTGDNSETTISNDDLRIYRVSETEIVLLNRATDESWIATRDALSLDDWE